MKAALAMMVPLPIAAFIQGEPNIPPANTTAITIPSPFRGSFETVPQIECFHARGSGIRISDDVVITARHVVQGNMPCGVDGVPVEVAYHEPGKDFTALKVKLGPGYRATYSCEGIQAGRQYLAFGYANGGKANVEPLLGTNQVSGDLTMLRGKVYKGMSGGAIETTEGAVVAIINMTHKEADWAYVLPLSATYLCQGGQS